MAIINSILGWTGTVGTALAGTYGTLLLNGNGTYTYTLDNGDADTQALGSGDTVTEQFSYTTIDAKGAISTSTLTVTVAGANDRPVVTSTAADAAGDVSEAGTSVTGTPTASGTLASADVDAGATATWSVAAANGTYGTLAIDPATGAWTYTLDDTRTATQSLNDGDTATETFMARVTDEHGAYSEQLITISVHGSNDDVTGTGAATVPLTEDGSATGSLQDYVSDIDNILQVSGFTVDANGDGIDESYAPGSPVILQDADGNDLGTLTIATNGAYSFTPAANYAGAVPTVTYTITETGGATGTVTQTLSFDIAELADAPGMEADKTVNTTEDNAASLGLVAPAITDTGTGTTHGDNPERLGAITLTISGAGASGVTLSTGGTVLTPVGGVIRVVLVDQDHVNTVPAEDNANGIYYLTTAQYEALQANPAAESGKDFTVTVSATSYEVDAAGAPLPGVSGADSSQIIAIDVQAVTDGATLTNSGSTDLSGTEDGSIMLSDLVAARNNSDGNASADTDGSETYWYTVSGLPSGSVVTINGTNYNVGASGSVTSAASGTLAAAPAISVKPPTNFSGDITGVTVTLNSRDSDSDSSGSIDTLTSSVSLNLHVSPVAGDVTASGVTTPEDTAVAFLRNVAVSDSGTGTEVIDSISFTVPAGWVVTPPPAPTGWSYNLTGSTATITFDGSLTEAQREAVLDAFTIRPPAHSSADATVALSITTTDSNMVAGHAVSDTKTVDRNVTIQVNAVAERTDSDSDGAGGNDVTMSGDHAYSTPGHEDTWFDLSTDGSFQLAVGWSDADSDETLYAVLTPTLSGAAAGDTVMGTQFRYSTDGGSTWVTQSYYGDPVEVPAQYLDTLQVKLPSDVSGTLTIGVQAGTSDTDPDTGVTVTAVSGSSTLSLIRFDPVADAVTMALNGRAAGLEDTEIPLSVKTTSSDPSETFNVTISGIPAGAKITYNGVEQTVSGNSVTILNFSNSAPLSVTPPPNSNADFSLTVSAVSVDGTDSSAAVSREIDVSVTGDADSAVIALPAISYTTSEAMLDSTGAHKVALSSLVASVASADTDVSETVTLRITGLAEGFSISGAILVTTGTGAERVWVVSADDLDTVFITVPDNYSGTVALKVAGVTTENDGDSFTSPLTDVSFTVTPSPEATLTTAATLVEDQISPLGLTIVHQNGDADEVLGDVYIRVGYDTSTYTLYLGGTALADANLGVTSISGVDYYVVPASQVAELGAKGAANLDGSLGSLDLMYDIVDPSTDGTLPSVTATRSGTVTIAATPVTDMVDASITAIGMTTATGTVTDAHAGDDATPDTVVVTGSGALTVYLHVDSADVDGSERLIRVLIDNVPDGVTVTGASQVAIGTWLLVYDGAGALSIGAGGIGVPVEYVVGYGLGASTSAITMTVLAQDRGDESTSPAAIVTDPVTWNLELALGPGDTYTPPSIDQWAYNNVPGTEDTSFALSDVIDAAVSTDDPGNAYSYTVTLTHLPEGTTVTGMTLTYLNGEALYTATVTVAPGGNSQAAVDTLLASISLVPPANSNDNNAAFSFDARLTAAAVGGPSVEAEATAAMPVIPVTDEAAVSVVTGDVDEGLTSVTATISVSDVADGAYGTIVDGKLYVQVSTTHNDGGTLSDSLGNPLMTTAVNGVPGIADGDYYVIDVGVAGGSVELTYTAASGSTLQPGDVTFAAWARTQETGAGNVALASATGTAAVVIVNNGVAVTSQPVTGNESAVADKTNAIALDGLAVALVDNDGSEMIQSVLLSGLPVGFLLYVGTSPDDATLATQASNAGGDGTSNTWVLSGDGTLPAYVAILPPTNWSGTLDGLALVVESGETSLSEARVDSVALETVIVEAVANGLTIDPTISFGTEGHVIDLNLNAAMADAIAAAATLADASIETTTLQIAGLGAHAAFYVGENPLLSVSYDAATDTYTITGLAQEDLDDLGFVQAASALTDQDGGAGGLQVTVTAWTVESGNGAASPPVTDTLTVDVTPVPATTGDDSFIWNGQAIDGKAGTDTVALRQGEDVSHGSLASLVTHVEVVDLSAPGANSITGGLSIADVLAITGSSAGTLTINGDSSDRIELSSAGEWSTNGIVMAGHVAYTSSSGATLLIDEDIYNNHHVSFAA